MNKPLKAVSLTNMIDKHVGKRGTARRDAFENELKIELLDYEIKQFNQVQKVKKEKH